MFWTIVLWVFLSLLGLLLLALLLPAVLYVDFRDGDFTLKLRVLFVKLTLFPMKERKAKPKKQRRKKKEKETPEEEEKPKKKRTLEEWIRLIKRLAASASAGTRFLLRHIYIRQVQLVLPVHGGEASDTATRTGQVQMLVGSARAVLANVMHVSYKALVILPDFTGQMQQGAIFSCKVLAAPVIMLAAAIVAFKRFLSYGRRRRRKRRRKNGANTRRNVTTIPQNPPKAASMAGQAPQPIQSAKQGDT